SRIKIFIAEEKRHGGHLRKVDGTITFDERAEGNAADERMVDDFGVAASSGAVAAEDQRALSDSVDAAVRRGERGEQQRASRKALGVADRRNRDIKLEARPREWREGGRDKNCGNVADLDRGDLALNVDAHALQHVAESLHGEECLLLVA